MTLEACAQLVERGDRDRFFAAMAAQVEARKVLFPLYAFNLEVARAPWVTEEPLIAEMRLQWWRDALEEIAKGGPVRRHEVTSPLSAILNPTLAPVLDQIVEARRWDISKEPFENARIFETYLEHTGGALMWTAAHSLGAPVSSASAISALGKASALVRFLRAVPELEARGRIPLIDGRPDAVATLARNAYGAVKENLSIYKELPMVARGALLEAWQTRPLLAQIMSDPMRVANGDLGLSPFRSKLRLLVGRI